MVGGEHSQKSIQVKLLINISKTAIMLSEHHRLGDFAVARSLWLNKSTATRHQKKTIIDRKSKKGFRINSVMRSRIRE